MKKLVSILLIGGFLALVMKPMGPYLEYILNKEFIANNYCVNQDRPQLKCNGACYLMKQLKAQAEQSKEQNVVQQIPTLELAVVFPEFAQWLQADISSKKFVSPAYALLSEWIHPPVAPPPRVKLA